MLIVDINNMFQQRMAACASERERLLKLLKVGTDASAAGAQPSITALVAATASAGAAPPASCAAGARAATTSSGAGGEAAAYAAEGGVLSVLDRDATGVCACVLCVYLLCVRTCVCASVCTCACFSCVFVCVCAHAYTRAARAFELQGSLLYISCKVGKRAPCDRTLARRMQVLQGATGMW